MRRSTLIVAVALLLAQVAYAQLPPSFESVLAWETLRSGTTQGPIQVGEDVRWTVESPRVVVKPSKEPQLVWSEELYFPGASYIAPHFEYLNLPPGSFVVVRSPVSERTWQYAATGKGRLGVEGGFWGIHIAGDKAVVELWARGPVPPRAVRIDRIARGWDHDPSFAPKALCGTDDARWAKCYQSSEPTIYNESKAVARLLLNGSSACTGWLLGNEGHLMTNEHCIGSSSTALNTDYEFMAEGATCSTNCASWFACPGTVVANSATLIQLDSALDYSLVKLPTNPTGTYGYMQMRQTSAVINERIYIPNHPQAWGKKISVESTHSQDQSGYCEVYSNSQTPCSGGPGDTGYYCDTQGGSSGSPVLAYSDHCVVSLHHCANCPNRGVPVTAIISDLGSNLPNNALCGGCVPTEDPEVSCSDGVDNDCDGLTDGDDPDCATCTPTEDPEVSCSDGVDNDCDGLTDGADPDCQGPSTCPPGSINFSSYALTSYSNQNVSNNYSVLDSGDTLRLQDNTWIRSTQTYNVTANTVIDFDFGSGAQGEIHAIGFDENDTLNDYGRHFMFWGTQNWTGAGKAADWSPQYSGGGSYQSFSIPVGQYYTGSKWLVFTNDNDSGSGNEGKFKCVRVYDTEPPDCDVQEGFESGMGGWTTSGTCTTGTFTTGTPDYVENGGVVTQLSGAHGGSNALFTQPNTGGAGTDDVDGGECVATSPVYNVTAASDVSVWYYHGQRDAGDDPSGDWFYLQYRINGGWWQTMAANGDSTMNAAWTNATATAGNGDTIQFRVRASDGAGPGDLVEAGVDDVTVCAQ